MSKVWLRVGRIALFSLTAGSTTVAGDTHVRFEVGQPFRVGGRGYEAGVISVHNVTAYTPSTSMLEVWVNGECLGMMPGYRSVADDPDGQEEAIFRRDGDGRLELTGFQLTGPESGATYRFP